MKLLNTEELKRQIAEGTFTGLDDITNEFKQILKEVIETASEEELTAHLGYVKNKESDNKNYRNGYNDKTIKSKFGNLDVAIPRDRNASFEPQLVKKREIILNGSEDMIISLYSKGMSVRDIQLHLDDLSFLLKQFQILQKRLLKKRGNGKLDPWMKYILLFLWMQQY